MSEQTTTTHTLTELRYWTTDMVRAQGYGIAYCPACSCRKSGDVDEPNGVDEGCTSSTCRCHDEDAR